MPDSCVRNPACRKPHPAPRSALAREASDRNAAAMRERVAPKATGEGAPGPDDRPRIPPQPVEKTESAPGLCIPAAAPAAPHPEPRVPSPASRERVSPKATGVRAPPRLRFARKFRRNSLKRRDPRPRFAAPHPTLRASARSHDGESLSDATARKPHASGGGYERRHGADFAPSQHREAPRPPLTPASPGPLRVQQRNVVARRDAAQHFADRRSHRWRRADLPAAAVRAQDSRRFGRLFGPNRAARLVRDRLSRRGVRRLTGSAGRAIDLRRLFTQDLHEPAHRRIGRAQPRRDDGDIERVI